MCSTIGVDPLIGVSWGGGGQRRGGARSGWGVLGVGEFWVRVATRTVGVCRRTRGGNGGVISVREVQRILAREDNRVSSSTKARTEEEISEYDLGL